MNVEEVFEADREIQQKELFTNQAKITASASGLGVSLSSPRHNLTLLYVGVGPSRPEWLSAGVHSLEPHIIKAAARADCRDATKTLSSGEVWLHAFRSSRQVVLREHTFAKDQLIFAAGRNQATPFSDEVAVPCSRRPKGRRDAELNEGTKWLAVLAEFLENSLLLCENPSNKQFLEAGWVDQEQSVSRKTVPRRPCGHDHVSR